MSLYNMLFRENPFSNVLLKMLGTDQNNIPRYRDCFLNKDGSEIIVHTRTGGGNRDAYERDGEYWEEGMIDNDTLRRIPGYKSDEDDSFDSTYANFHFEVPEPFKEQVLLLLNLGATTDPAQKWKNMLDAMQRRDQSDPVVQRAMEVGKTIMNKLNEQKGGIIEI